MDHAANVRSIDAVRAMTVALEAFGEDATAALAELGMNVQRAIQWVQYDQREHWTARLRRAQFEVEEARLNLERKKMNRISDHEPSCREEKLALDAAKRRVLLARDKLEAVRRWSRQLEHELIDQRSAVAPLASWLQTELPKALAALSVMGKSLEAYVGISSTPGLLSGEHADNSSDSELSPKPVQPSVEATDMPDDEPSQEQ